MKNHQITKSPNRQIRRAAASGFTLIEAALTMVIVGVGILAMVSAQQAYHQKNDWAQRTGSAQMLANEIRELTLSLPHHDPITGSANLGPESNETSAAGPQTDVANYDDLDDFAGTVTGAGYGSGVTFNPPINGLRLEIDGLEQWSQSVTVENVFPDNLAAGAANVQPLGSTDMMRVTVDVLYQQSSADPVETITTMTWVVAR